MLPTTHPSRIHLLAAKVAPIVAVLQRKRAKLFHVVTIDTEKHQIDHGSWFNGMIYALDSDVSFDGKHMVYLARGRRGNTWSGVCRLPWLTTLVHVEDPITGGGYFSGAQDLKTCGWDGSEKIFSTEEVGFTIERDRKPRFGSELAVIYGRFERDGFVRLGENWGEEQRFTTPTYHVVCTGDEGWGHRPGGGYPELQMRYLGYFEHGPRFGLTLDEYPHLLEGASWATWDSGKCLWVARPGIVEQYTLDDLRRGRPSYSLDLDQFEPPTKPGE